MRPLGDWIGCSSILRCNSVLHGVNSHGISNFDGSHFLSISVAYETVKSIMAANATRFEAHLIEVYQGVHLAS